MGKSELQERRALSAQDRLWQSRALADIGWPVKRSTTLATLCLTGLVLTVPAAGAPGGPIGLLRVGTYVCELPGDATGPVGHRIPEADFSVLNDSTYEVAGKTGSYLLTGDRLVMTSGPHKGRRYHRLSDGFVRPIGPDGSDSEMRCIRRTRNNR